MKTANISKQGRSARGRMQYKLEETDQWFMLLVRPGKELQARACFTRYGVRAYWPNFSKTSHWSPQRRRHSRTDYRSVIPGYLFVPALPTNTFWGVIDLNGDIVNVVRGYSGEMATLKNADIEVIRSIEAAMNTPQPGKSLHNFKTGDKVRFVDDTMNRLLPGIVTGSINDGRISVEVEMMGRVVPFQVFPHRIERA